MDVEILSGLADQTAAVNPTNANSFRGLAAQESPPVGGLRKRQFDILCSVLALIALSPLFLLIALVIKLSNTGPIFFRHRRIGQNGVAFECLKFRTMRPEGGSVLEAYFRSHPDAYTEWRESRKLKHDPRVTAIGEFLRKTSLDELPQIINIIVGDMSIVGPRPVVADEIGMYGADARHYLAARPGLTGAWQVSGRNDVSYGERVRLDRGYVENWSMATDLRIILRTVPAVFFSRGSY